MGFALAEAAANAGASVTLIAGPVNLPTPSRVKRVDVVSAEDMYHAVLAQIEGADIFVGAAAVADYRVAEIAPQKLKKTADDMAIRLIRNPDIISAVAASAPQLFCVGFAAETERVAEHAQEKLQRKKLQMIIANDVSNTAIGFNSEDNAVTAYWSNGEQVFAQANKYALAEQLWQLIAVRRNSLS
jgi:phosphopantothenoylcysteine decarboxylase/phosphopantothenate--cysteine ligase